MPEAKSNRFFCTSVVLVRKQAVLTIFCETCTLCRRPVSRHGTSIYPNPACQTLPSFLSRVSTSPTPWESRAQPVQVRTECPRRLVHMKMCNTFSEVPSISVSFPSAPALHFIYLLFPLLSYHPRANQHFLSQF